MENEKQCSSCEEILKQIEPLMKSFKGLEHHVMFPELRRIINFVLIKGDRELRGKMLQMVFLIMSPEILRMNTYFNAMSQEQKFPEYRKLLQILPKEYVDKIINYRK